MHVKNDGIKLSKREDADPDGSPEASPIDPSTRLSSALEAGKDAMKEKAVPKIKKLQGKSLHLGEY